MRNPAGWKRCRYCAGLRLSGMVEECFVLIAGQITERYLLGSRFGVADALFYVTLRWARMVEMPVPERLLAYIADVEARPAVQRALQQERLL
jgi:glutathione S-transferase